MVHNVVATTFYTLECACYQCSRQLQCPVCPMLEQNPWRLSGEELRSLRDALAAEQHRGPADETGAAVCPHCDLLVACAPCRLAAPLDLERVHALARRRARRKAA